MFRLGFAAMFKRIHCLPKRWYKHAPMFGRSVRADYYYRQSRKRFEQRDDAHTDTSGLLTGEIGRYEGFNWIEI